MRITSKTIVRAFSAGALLSVLACDGATPFADEPWASRLELNTTALEIRDGGVADVRATLFDANGRPLTSPTSKYAFQWTVGDSSLLRIEGSGPQVEVRSRGVGSTTLSVRAVELWTANNGNGNGNGNNGNGNGNLGKSLIVRSKQQPESMTIVSGDKQSATVNTALPKALEVQLLDKQGQPVPEFPVEFRAVDNAGKLSSASVQSDAEGIAAASWTLGTVAGDQQVEVSGEGVESVRFTARAAPAAAAALQLVSGNDQVSRPSTKVGAPLVVRVTDIHGNGVSGTDVAWSVTSGGGSIAGGAKSGSNGEASATWTLGSSTGTNRVVASAAGKSVQFSATATNVASVKITSSRTPFTSLGESFVFVAQARDVGGNPVTGVTFTWTSSNPSVLTADASGKMTAKSVGTVLVIAAAAGLADTLAVAVQQVASNIQLSNTSISVPVGGTSQLQAVVKDGSGNTISNGSVVWSSSAPGVATVKDGLVTGVSNGAAVILAKSGNATAQASVTVGGGSSSQPSNGSPELPRVWVNTDWVEPTGQRIFVPAGGDLQAAINNARRGDVIELQAGATFTGQFTLPPKSGSGWVVIRSAGSLPAPGTRVTPAQAASLPKLVNARADQRVLVAASGASHYRIVGLEITFANSVTRTNAIVDMQNGSSHIILDRSYVHGHDNMDLQRCVIMHAEHAAVIDSYLSKCHYKGADSQAIIAFNTNGPLKIVNNYLEGAGENVMFGGATPSANTLPSDIEIRRNHFFKPQSWRLSDGSSRWTVKNLFEIKFARRVLLEANVFDGNWRDGQDGHAFNIKLSAIGSGNQVTDITIRHNIVRNTQNGLKISSPVDRVEVANNIIIANDRAFSLYGAGDLSLLNNTAVHGGNIISSVASHARFVARGNIWGSVNGYGIKGGGSEGTPTLDADFPGWSYDNNGHIGRQSSRYPSGNRFVSGTGDVGFVNLSSGDVRLRSDSPFAGMGADVNKILNMTAGVVQ